MRDRPQTVDLTGAILGDPVPDRSALARRIAERLADLDRTPQERERARISAAHPDPWLRTTYEGNDENGHA